MCYAQSTVHFEYSSEPDCVSGVVLNIYSTDLSGIVEDKKINTVIINGRRAIRARFPNGDPETMGMHTNPSGLIPRAINWTEYDNHEKAYRCK